MRGGAEEWPYNCPPPDLPKSLRMGAFLSKNRFCALMVMLQPKSDESNSPLAFVTLEAQF